MEKLSRRSLLARSPLPLLAAAGPDKTSSIPRKLTVVVVGAHVDDPQSGCGGTMARLADLGHEVIALSLTRGDSASIAASLHMDPQELAAKRYADAQQSCALLRCRLVALHFGNRNIQVTGASYEEFAAALSNHKPDIVFTHWPIDTHPDHRAGSLFSYDAWLRAGRAFPLYFYEVETGQQTQDFWPTHYVDITSVAEKKKTASYANTVTVDGWWPLHDRMQRSRGKERGFAFAEAFNRHPQSPDQPALALP
jgi:LmbE family N-acetylglucosaminyl deacetylase